MRRVIPALGNDLIFNRFAFFARNPQRLNRDVIGCIVDAAKEVKARMPIQTCARTVQRPVSILCLVLMVSCVLVPDATASQSPSVPLPTLKEQIVKISSGSVIDVRLKRKKTPPRRGRLGAISDSGFEL